MYPSVDIGRRITGEALERILLEAAKELGLKARVKDNFRGEYKLGSVTLEERYEGTEIRLWGRVLPIATITGINKESESDWFAVSTGVVPHLGFGSERQIKAYLSLVSAKLPQQKRIGDTPY